MDEPRGLFNIRPQGILREVMRQHHANPIDRCSSTDYESLEIRLYCIPQCDPEAQYYKPSGCFL